MQKKYNISVVCDLDGTLVDTAPDLMIAANFVLESAGFLPITPIALRSAMSHGARRIIENGLNEQGVVLEADRVDSLTRELLNYYRYNFSKESRIYDGVFETLYFLKKNGACLSVCTNKVEQLARNVLKSLDIDNFFDAICGRDTFSVCKPHPDHLLNTIASAGGDARRAVMVGDSGVDIATAKAADILIIAVSYGYCDTAVSDMSPAMVINRFEALPAAISAIGLGS